MRDKSYGYEKDLYFTEYRPQGRLVLEIVELKRDAQGEYITQFSAPTRQVPVKCEEGCAFLNFNGEPDGLWKWLVSNGLGFPTGRVYRAKGNASPYFEFKFNMDTVEVCKWKSAQK